MSLHNDCNYKNYDTIFVKDLVINCIIGLLPQERVYPQNLIVDLELYTNLDKIFEEDNIEHSINYVEAIEVVKDCVVKAQALTIEHLLGIIIKKLHSSFEEKLIGVHVRIRKPEILTETKNLGVCATRFFK
jgi:dihydroneopterin aldolase